VAYGLHWEWRGFGILPASVRETIEDLPAQFPTPGTVKDEYLWVPGCRINLKLRSGEAKSLKFKRLRDSDPATGLELWEERAEEDYKFPVSPGVVVGLGAALGVRANQPPGSLDREALLQALQRADSRIKVLAVDKVRRARLYPLAAGRLIVEVAELTSPQLVTSVGIEDDLGLTDASAADRVEAAKRSVAAAVRQLGLDGALTRLNYVDAVTCWAEGGTLSC